MPIRPASNLPISPIEARLFERVAARFEESAFRPAATEFLTGTAQNSVKSRNTHGWSTSTIRHLLCDSSPNCVCSPNGRHGRRRPLPSSCGLNHGSVFHVPRPAVPNGDSPCDRAFWRVMDPVATRSTDIAPVGQPIQPPRPTPADGAMRGGGGKNSSAPMRSPKKRQSRATRYRLANHKT